VRMQVRRGLAICSLLLSSVAGAANAQPARDPAAAEGLFRDAIKALDAGDWAAACPKFSASMELDPSPGTSINVARCHEHDGKLAKAWAEYQRAKVLNQETAGTQRKQELAIYIDKQIAVLEPRLPRLRIRVSARPEGLHVERDGQPVPAGALGEPVPVDPGTRVVTVGAPGHRTERREVAVAEGQSADVTIELALEATPPPTTNPTATVAPRRTTPPARSDGEEAPSSGRRTLAFGLIGAGVVGLGIGAVTGGLAIGKNSDVIDDGCDAKTRTCGSQAGIDAARAGRTLATVSTVAFVAGAALGGAGVVLLLVRPGSSTVAVGPSVSHAGVGIRVGGSL